MNSPFLSKRIFLFHIFMLICSTGFAYAVIKRFDSLREITTSRLADTNKLAHIGITFKISRSTLADANKRRSETIFEAIYRDLYARYKGELISDSRSRKQPKWMDRLQIIDSTTITLFSNLIFKGVGQHPKAWHSMFFSSGAALQTSKGTLMVVAPVRTIQIALFLF